MDWALAIDRNRNALLRMVVALCAAVGLTQGGSVAVLPRHLRCAVLRMLRPAESATRRLIVIAAQSVCATADRVRPAPTAPIPRGAGRRTPCFALLDPLKRHPRVAWSARASIEPRISMPGLADPAFIAERLPASEDPVSAARLGHRLRALRHALDDLPAQARRLARWRAKRDRASSGRLSSLRPGRPPGYRARPRDEIDTILSDCHALARIVLKPPDTA